jgi:hypothetical protein
MTTTFFVVKAGIWITRNEIILSSMTDGTLGIKHADGKKKWIKWRPKVP